MTSIRNKPHNTGITGGLVGALVFFVRRISYSGLAFATALVGYVAAAFISFRQGAVIWPVVGPVLQHKIADRLQ